MLLSARPPVFLWGQTGIPMNGLTNSWMCLLLGGAEGRIPPGLESLLLTRLYSLAGPDLRGPSWCLHSLSCSWVLGLPCLILWTSGLGTVWVPGAAASGFGSATWQSRSCFCPNSQVFLNFQPLKGPRP